MHVCCNFPGQYFLWTIATFPGHGEKVCGLVGSILKNILFVFYYFTASYDKCILFFGMFGIFYTCD